VTKYLQLRDNKKQIEDKHKEELAPINELLGELEALFQKAMDETGLEQLKSDSGVAYKSVQRSVKASDKTAFLEWVQENEAWHLLDIRPAKTAVSEYTDENGTPPPGVDISSHLKINVRKG